MKRPERQSRRGLMGAGAWLLLGSACGDAGRVASSPRDNETGEPTLRLEPKQNDQRIVMLHSLLFECSWTFRVPEATQSREGMLAVSFWPAVRWTVEADGSIRCEWESTEEGAAEATAKDRFGFTYLAGVRQKVAITPTDYGALLELTVSNGRTSSLHGVSVNPCLGYPTCPSFRTDDRSTTFVLVDGKMTPTAGTDRGDGDPIRTYYRVLDRHVLWNIPTSYWGNGSRTVLSSGAVCRVSRDRKAVIGAAWKQADNVMENCDQHQCIHSVGTIGDLSPGQARTVTGAVIHVRGDEQTFFDRVRQLGLS